MVDIIGTSADETFVGTSGDDYLSSQGGDDLVRGGRGDDLLSGGSGDDVIYGGRGEDVLIGGRGSDVLAGGLDADLFLWGASQIGEGETDYVTDFNISTGDTFEFRPSGDAALNVLSVSKSYRTETEANGVDLRNNLDKGTDVTFVVQNSETGATQEIVLFDAWSASKNDLWVDLLASMGLAFDDEVEEIPEECEDAPHDGGPILPGDGIVDEVF